jgi:Zn-dependent protease
MLKFSLFGVPVAVEWWFWIATVLLGGGASLVNTPEGLLLIGEWTLVVFVSILVHELGHAWAGKHFGATPFIRLHGLGGVTFLPGARFTRPQSFLVSAAGPAAGLTLGLLVLAISETVSSLPPLARWAIRDARYVNFFWTFINIMPVHPLDGGQMLDQLLGPSRRRLTGFIGFVVAVLICLWAFKNQRVFLGLMMAMLAYYNLRREPVQGGVVTE